MSDDFVEELAFGSDNIRNVFFNFMKCVSLLGAIQALENKTPESEALADGIMKDVIEGYLHETHLVH